MPGKGEHCTWERSAREGLRSAAKLTIMRHKRELIMLLEHKTVQDDESA